MAGPINASNGRLDFHSEAYLKFRMSVQIALMTIERPEI